MHVYRCLSIFMDISLTCDDVGLQDEFLSNHVIFEDYHRHYDEDTVSWLLNNHVGIHPSTETLQEIYEKLSSTRCEDIINPDSEITNQVVFQSFRSHQNDFSSQTKSKITEKAILRHKQWEKYRDCMENKEIFAKNTLKLLKLHIDESFVNEIDLRVSLRIKKHENSRKAASSFHVLTRNMDETDIHAYSGMNIVDNSEDVTRSEENALHDEIEQNNTSSSRHQSLNQVVIACLHRKVDNLSNQSMSASSSSSSSSTHAFTEDQVIQTLSDMITRYLPSSQHTRSFQLIGEIMDSRSIESLKLVIVYLQHYHSEESQSVWIQGFLGNYSIKNTQMMFNLSVFVQVSQSQYDHVILVL